MHAVDCGPCSLCDEYHAGTILPASVIRVSQSSRAINSAINITPCFSCHPSVIAKSQQLRGEVLAMVSEDEDYDEEEANRVSVEDRAADSQRRLWTSEPSQRDDVLPLFVWSIVHDQDRKKADLNAFLDVSDTLL